MRKPHLGSVDGAISSGLDNGKNVAILGVEDYLFDGSLSRKCVNRRAFGWLGMPSPGFVVVAHLEALESGAGHCASA